MSRSAFALGLLLVGVLSAPSGAQEIEFRRYANTPVGTNALGVGYSFASGNVLLDPGVSIDDLDADL
jgi:hypothetical protein